MHYIFAFLLMAASANAAIYNERPFIASASSGTSSATVAVTATQIPYGTGTGIASTPSLTYISGTLTTYGFANTGPVNLDGNNTVNVIGNAGLFRGMNVFDGATNVAKIVPSTASGGLTMYSNITSTNAYMGFADSSGVGRVMRAYVGNGNASGMLLSGSGFSLASSTLQVSGTAILPICSNTMTCTAAESVTGRKECFSTVLNTKAVCNGNGSFILMVSNTTPVSASAL